MYLYILAKKQEFHLLNLFGSLDVLGKVRGGLYHSGGWRLAGLLGLRQTPRLPGPPRRERTSASCLAQVAPPPCRGGRCGWRTVSGVA